MNPPDGHLFRNMVLFARLLRAVGLEPTPDQVRDWVLACRHIDLARRSDFRCASESLLVRKAADLEIFGRAFDLFWRARDPRELEELDLGMLIKKVRERSRRSSRSGTGPDGQGREEGDQESPEPQKVETWSDSERLRRKDFAELEATELEQVKSMLHDLDWQLDERATRRRVARRRGRFIDPRRTFRQSLAQGGEILQFARRDRKFKRRPLVVLCDISGSMEPYSRILLQFLFVITQGLVGVEAFVFGTRLTRITTQLRKRDVDSALTAVHHEVVDFGGGTRIGEALKTFNFHWSRRVLGRGAAVLVISDGWDRGEVDVLRREMDRLQRSCHRLIWLNPLLGSPRYEPLTRGIQAALPFIDDFLPVHNLESLEQLGRHLGQLDRSFGARPLGARPLGASSPGGRLRGQSG